MCKERRETEVGKYGQFSVMRAIRSKCKADDWIRLELKSIPAGFVLLPPKGLLKD